MAMTMIIVEDMQTIVANCELGTHHQVVFHGQRHAPCCNNLLSSKFLYSSTLHGSRVL